MSNTWVWLVLGAAGLYWWSKQQAANGLNNGGLPLSGDCPPGYVPGPRMPCWNGNCPPDCVPVVAGGPGGGGFVGTITPTTYDYDWPV